MMMKNNVVLDENADSGPKFGGGQVVKVEEKVDEKEMETTRAWGRDKRLLDVVLVWSPVLGFLHFSLVQCCWS